MVDGIGRRQGGGLPKGGFVLQKFFQKRKMATKRVPRARISVSTPELAIIFRGESVSGHPGAGGGPKSLNYLDGPWIS